LIGSGKSNYILGYIAMKQKGIATGKLEQYKKLQKKLFNLYLLWNVVFAF
jgi:membrane protein YqaA with SNARE-associated domain